MSYLGWLAIAVACWILSGPILLALAILAVSLKRAIARISSSPEENPADAGSHTKSDR